MRRMSFTSIISKMTMVLLNMYDGGTIEKLPNSPTRNRLFYMSHKPVIREEQPLQKLGWCSMQAQNLTTWPTVSMTACKEDHPYSHSCGIH